MQLTFLLAPTGPLQINGALADRLAR